MTNSRTYPKKLLTAAMTGAFVFASLSTNAAITVDNAKRIKQDYPLKSADLAVNTMENWLVNNPDTYALNPVNVRGGFHPDRSDPDEKGGGIMMYCIFSRMLRLRMPGGTQR